MPSDRLRSHRLIFYLICLKLHATVPVETDFEDAWSTWTCLLRAPWNGIEYLTRSNDRAGRRKIQKLVIWSTGFDLSTGSSTVAHRWMVRFSTEESVLGKPSNFKDQNFASRKETFNEILVTKIKETNSLKSLEDHLLFMNYRLSDRPSLAGISSTIIIAITQKCASSKDTRDALWSFRKDKFKHLNHLLFAANAVRSKRGAFWRHFETGRSIWDSQWSKALIWTVLLFVHILTLLKFAFNRLNFFFGRRSNLSSELFAPAH